MIFNRSHYEDILVVREHELVLRNIWSKRYSQINSFEKLLSDEGTIIIFFLHIDIDEQKERLQARLDDPNKQWKFRKGDLEERNFGQNTLRHMKICWPKPAFALLHGTLSLPTENGIGI